MFRTGVRKRSYWDPTRQNGPQAAQHDPGNVDCVIGRERATIQRVVPYTSLVAYPSLQGATRSSQNVEKL